MRFAGRRTAVCNIHRVVYRNAYRFLPRSYPFAVVVVPVCRHAILTTENKHIYRFDKNNNYSTHFAVFQIPARIKRRRFSANNRMARRKIDFRYENKAVPRYKQKIGGANFVSGGVNRTLRARLGLPPNGYRCRRSGSKSFRADNSVTISPSDV